MTGSPTPARRPFPVARPPPPTGRAAPPGPRHLEAAAQRTSSSVLPTVARASIAAWASAARSSGKRWPITGRRRPATASASALSVNARVSAGAGRAPRRSVTPRSVAVASVTGAHSPLGRAEAHHPAARVEQLEGRAGDRAADAVEDDVHSADRRADPVGPGRLAVVDRDVGAELPRELDLALTAGRRDDGGAGRPRELDQQRADAAGCRLDQHPLTAADPGLRDEHRRRSPVGQQRDRVVERQAVRHRDEPGGVHRDALGVPARAAGGR